MVRPVLIAAALSVSGTAVAPPPASPAPEPTRARTLEHSPFVRAAIWGCAYSRARGVPISALPDEARVGFHPATGEERRLAKDSATPVWASDTLGAHVVIMETSPGKCIVVGDGLPVEATFHEVIEAAKAVNPTWREVRVKGGYNPIAYRLVRQYEAKRYMINLSGSEPGGLANPLRMLQGHAMSTTLLIAEVTVEPVGAPPSTP